MTLKSALLPFTILASLFMAGTALAADECKVDSDCKNGDLCILAVTPHVCKPPQPPGAACKRDVVCKSQKCDMPKGKEVGSCT